MRALSILLTALVASPALGLKLPSFKKGSTSDSSDMGPMDMSSDSAAPEESSGDSSSDNSAGGTAEFPLMRVQGVPFEPPLGKSPKTPGATITKMKYGPYSVRGGELQNYPLPLKTLDTPCKNCWITAFQAGLEYEDGTRANIDSGMWLHHMVLHDNSHKDNNCFYQTQRIFATGNERVTRRTNTHGKWAYYLGRKAVFSDVHELMNESNQRKTVYITIKFEWLPDSKATGYKKVTPIWLDVTGGCGIGDIAAKTGKYDYRMKWKSNVSGPLLEAVGHVHDGGTDITISVNDKTVCTSGQVYGGKPEYIEPSSMGAMAGMKHISQCGVCQNFGNIEKGDTVKMVANYDTTLHKQMKEGAKLMPVMGIVIAYVGTS